MEEGVLLQKLHSGVCGLLKPRARNLYGVGGCFKAGDVQRDMLRAGPPAHCQRDVAAAGTYIQDAHRAAISEIVGYPVNIEVEGDIGNGHGAWVVTRREAP